VVKVGQRSQVLWSKLVTAQSSTVVKVGLALSSDLGTYIPEFRVVGAKNNIQYERPTRTSRCFI
jgi:hypothetical protein